MCIPRCQQIKVLFTAALLCAGVGISQDSEASSGEGEDSVPPPPLFDKIWASNTLYSNPDNASFQSFSLIGRYHGQYWSVDADQGDADGWDNRRIIFGFDTRLYQDFKVEFQIHMNGGFSPVYDELYVGFIQWAPQDQDFALSLGRLDYVFNGLERTTSSKRIATIERSQLVNQLMPGEVFGLYGKTQQEFGSIQAGVFTGANTEEFGDFDSGFGATAGIELNLPLLYDSGSLHLDYLYNDGDRRNNAFETYRDVASLWHQGQIGPWDIGLDLTWGGHNYEGRSDVWGVTLLPVYELSRNLLIGGDALQLAFRYHYSSAKNNNGLTLQRRYEQEVTTEHEGDQYQSAYLGFNYLLYGHKLKLMAGLEYAQMDDAAKDGGAYQGWTGFAGVRLYF